MTGTRYTAFLGYKIFCPDEAWQTDFDGASSVPFSVEDLESACETSDVQNVIM